jgi:dipeptidase
LTKGRAAGPFGDPTRYEKNPDQDDTFNLNIYKPTGAWERPLSIYRCGMIWINQGRSFLPDPVGGVCWIGLDRPAANCLMPFYVGVNELPQSLETMNLIDFTRDSAWWAFNFVANYATIKYSYMIKDINEKQKELEGGAYDVQHAVDQAAQILWQNDQEKLCKSFLTSFCKSSTERVVSEWWKLSETLIVKYNDGCITTEENVMQQVGYPKDWLDDVGYDKGPTSYKKQE